jgi:Ca2+-binding RTX toxin-like protein
MRVLVQGGDGNDKIVGGSSNPMRFTAYGQNGADRLKGTAADDLLDGGAGGDLLRGLAGADTLIGGAGHDRGSGGPGNDGCESIETGAEAECS